MHKKGSPAAIGFLALIIIVFLIAVFSSNSANKTTASSPSFSMSNTSSTSPVIESKPEPSSPWSYSTDEDQMGRKRSFAEVTSTNTLSFDFPYQGSQHGTLMIRKIARWGTEVLLHIEHGQFLCGIEDCELNVRFDSGPILQFSAAEPADHDTTLLFIHNAPRFIANLRKAKTVRIEATFYQEGSQTLEFDVEGFKWQ